MSATRFSLILGASVVALDAMRLYVYRVADERAEDEEHLAG